MITDAFDKSEVLFGPKDFYGWDLYDFLVQIAFQQYVVNLRGFAII